MGRTVAQKMGVREGSRARLVDAPREAVAALDLPALTWVREGEQADHLHLFARRRDALAAAYEPLVADLATGGTLWVSWPKGGRLGSDLTLPVVIATAYDAGLVESTCLRVDDTWAALKLTRPRPGKVYANSYGTLPWQR